MYERPIISSTITRNLQSVTLKGGALKSIAHLPISTLLLIRVCWEGYNHNIITMGHNINSDEIAQRHWFGGGGLLPFQSNWPADFVTDYRWLYSHARGLLTCSQEGFGMRMCRWCDITMLLQCLQGKFYSGPVADTMEGQGRCEPPPNNFDL